MLKEDEIYRYLGIFTLTLFFIYIVSCVLNTQNNIIEGLTNQKKPLNIQDDLFSNLDKHLKENNDRLSDSLLIKKYKTQYEDSIIEIDTNTELKILQLTILYGNALANKDDKEAKKYLEEINLLQNLKVSLKNTMKHVDKH
tara:strand:- start:213 stop:635 length:423 start_codon:yes stop_codon:yes gene_type:complete